MSITLNLENFIILLTTLNAIGALIALYFWLQDKKEERQHKQSNLTQAHK
ncbi:MAG: hypothetical protein N2738_01190 [Thermodesulfovibrionales bacterium]|nr:hypothetical protein [Thermodesulfovibrionales bacterium]